ncbi:Ig-like domain repeat protein [Nocardioides sp. zg-DK7169]|uniref:Ig-like domain repeat protein n=1 Tax=Nocardioides sp. zg-DK7169 TaxID=2736600 RepID=UPI001554FBFC|nr:Ig-like domain repeat protein [Nocardioides sp. zg-DK7169]NPC97299.1 hypothetical protein [Nocardioides sp. zg-DK7169]
MKKLIAGLFAAILTTAGLVAVSSAPAQAACKQGYTCVNTRVNIAGANVVKRGKPVKVKFRVGTNGNIAPKGTVTVVLKKAPNGRTITRTVSARKAATAINFGKLGKGKWNLTIRYNGDDGFKNANNKKTIRVR